MEYLENLTVFGVFITLFYFPLSMPEAKPKIKRPTAKSVGKPLNKQVTFKLTESHLGRLSKLAVSDGISHHEKARRIVEASLDGDKREMDDLRLEVKELRAIVETQQKGMTQILGLMLSLLPDENGERLLPKVARKYVQTALEKGEV